MQIQEFRSIYNNSDKDVKIDLIGSKWIIANEQTEFKSWSVQPMIDTSNQILGTKIDIDGCKTYELPN